MKIKGRVLKKEDTVLKFSVDRSFEDIFCHTLGMLGFSSNGLPLEEGSMSMDERVQGYRCKEYIIRPYSDFSDLPNFEHVPSGLKLSWYKYPLRESCSNRDLSFMEFMNILGWYRD